MRKLRRILIPVLAAIVAGSFAVSCSSRKNTAATRKYQAFITRFNVYYNGEEHFRETLAGMERNYEDDYTDFLFPHPAEAKGVPKAPQPSGDFKRSIEKAQKAIQLHSIKKKPKKKSGKQSDAYKAWLKREEYNPFIHNAWMMMARSQYLNGDFPGAAATFYYISRHFSWLPETVVEAQLWQARSYVAFDWVNEAEGIIKRIKPEQLTSGKLKALYDFIEADIALHRGEYEAAIAPLERTIKHTSGAQKTRLRFLLGQCLARVGRNTEAYKAFKQAAEAGGTTYRTKLNARIKQSEVYSGKDIAPEVKALKRMTHLDRNKPYLDQIYYAIGNLYLSRGDTAQAIENYILAADKSERNGIEKAISNITLGQLYFERGRYDLAQPRFSEAVPLLPETYADYELLKRRSDVLDELSVYAQNVVTQDSLLRLAAMSPDEQLKVINKIIDELKKKEKEEADEAARQAHDAEAAANEGGNTDPNAPAQFQMGSKDDSWYFYNSATVSAGKTAFQRKWGSRKLEDDWRRRNKASFSFNDFAETSSDDSADGQQPGFTGESLDAATQSDEDKEAAQRAADPHYPEYYLAQIPKTDEEKATANDVIQEGLYTMGSILKDKLEDFSAAETEWQRLLERYPDNIYRLDVYYNMYLMLMRLGKPQLAEKWRQLILSDFAESKYGIALQDPNYIQNLREMPAAQQALYDDAYAAYLANDNRAVHEAYETMMKKYPVSEIMPKFMFLHALAYVTEKDPENFTSTLRELLERYPQTDLTPLASAYLKGMKEGRKLNEGVANSRSMLWDIRLTAPGDSLGSSGGGADFEFNPAAPQMLVLAYPTDTISPNELLYQIARHNFNSFVVKDFDLEQMNFGQLGMLLVKGFANEEEAQHYRTLLGRSTIFTLPPQVRPFIISEDNFAKLISGGRTLEEYFRASDNETFDRVDPEGEAEDGDAPEEEETTEELETVPAEPETDDD